MDGSLSIHEQERVVTTRQMENFILPGPLCYVPYTDSFVTVSAALSLECYKFQTIISGDRGSKIKVIYPDLYLHLLV
jgi:Bardet-Biedl syndrome 9 protein